MEKINYQKNAKLKIVPDAIEKLIAETLETSEKRQLDQEETRLMLGLSMMEEEKFRELWNQPMPDSNAPAGKAIPFKDSKLLKILEARIKQQYNIVLTDRVLAFLNFLMNTPGEAVIWAAYIAYRIKHNMKTYYENGLEFHEFCMYVCPMGILTDETLRAFWNKQKCDSSEVKRGTDNLLDYYTSTSSLLVTVKEPVKS